MRASILDLRRRMSGVLRALDRKEPVTILYRGKEKGTLYPAAARPGQPGLSREHPAFGLWKGRDDLKDVSGHVRRLRRGRGHAL